MAQREAEDLIMEIKRHLETLAQKDPDLRRQALSDVLDAEGLSCFLQEDEPSFKNPRGTVNYILDPWQDAPSLLFCAHYDAVPGSFGANDNAAALCILIDLAKDLKENGVPARFAFFDGEETGNSGSRLYVSCLDRQASDKQGLLKQEPDRQVIRRQDLTGVVNLDVCGFGDTIAICGKGNENKPVFGPFCDKALLGRHNAQVLKYLPRSDEASFAGSRIPALSLCAIPRWDIQYLKAMATYGDGFLGRPPEFDMMMEQMEVSTTMHGGYRDHPEYVEPEAMSRIYHYLREAVTAPPAGRKKLFGLL
ncbi:M28 family peptidase [Clostridiales bacterium VE202-28]|uniref:M28 family peptidase n=1 Tax=Enterocloster sp. OA13 TaxID=2914161 RepID=UPI000471B55F